FAPVSGADRLLSRLAQRGSHRVALATGGWRDSARLKMASAGMCFDHHPAASADDALDREFIMRLSEQRAAERYGASFTSTVYVGDGVWDARASRSVGIPFIGIGLVRHGYGSKQWSTPGGRIEPGESPVTALLREVTEEIACEIRILHLIGVYAKPYRDDLVLSFHAMIVSGIPRACPPEISDA